MLVECPNCKLSFTPAFGVCPRCHTFRPNLAECDDFIRSRVRADIEAGFVKEDDLLRALQEKGMATGTAVELIRDERRRYKRRVRQRAMLRFAFGLLLAAAGPIFLFIGFFGGGRHPMMLGAMSLIVGLGFLWFGGMRLVRGRD
jgi:hypothetical protein